MESPADSMYIAFQLALGEQGRRNAMTRIWKLYEKGIYYYISRSFPGDPVRCDDCFQDTMLKVFNGLTGFSIGRPLKPWIYRIAHNCCQDLLRSRSEESLADAALPPAADVGDQEENFLRDELIMALDASINGLDVEDSRIAYLRFFEGMKFRDIAAILKMNEKTVKSRMAAIKRRLRSELREWL